MLSWVYTHSTGPNHTSRNFSAARINSTHLSPTRSDGDVGSEACKYPRDETPRSYAKLEPAQQTIQGDPARQEPLDIDPADYEPNVRHSHDRDHRHRRQLQHARSQQEKVPLRLNPQSLHETLHRGHPDNSDNTRAQRGRRAAPSSHACSGGRHGRGSGDSGRRGDCKRWCWANAGLSGVARQVPGGEREEPAAGGAFVSAGWGEGEAWESIWVEEEGFAVLDGAQDAGEDSSLRTKAGERGLSVRERVAALEAKGKKEIAAAASTVKQQHQQQIVIKGGGDVAKKSDVPIVYPLHYKRFVRRTSSGTPLRPETPLYRSLSDDEPMIHAPRPTRSIPAIKTPPEMPKVAEALKGAGSIMSQEPKAPGQAIAPASFLMQGTKYNCVRHGRKQPATDAKYMMTKSRSGAYIPTGITSRQQVEATSPWAIPSKSLTVADASKSVAGVSDVCPDCAAESSIKRRELLGGSGSTVKRPAEMPQTVMGPGSVQPSSPSAKQPSVRVDSWSQGSGDDGMVVAKDLGDGLDAVIVEHDGDLRRVVINARHGNPTIDTMQRLSRELAKVSSSIAFVGVRSEAATPVATHENRDCTVVMDSTTRAQGARMSSVPELLDMIDQAANEIHLSTGKIAEHYTSRRDVPHEDWNSLLSGSEFDDVLGHDASPAHGLVSRQSRDDQYRVLQGHLSNGVRKNSIQSAKSAASSIQQQPPSSQPPSRLDTVPPKSTPQALQSARLSSNVPRILTTKPTMPLSVTKTPQVSPSQTPPPAHPSVHHAAELSNPPFSTKPGASPTPKIQEFQHHGLFSTFLNPFHHQSSSPAKTGATQPPSKNPASTTSLYNSTPTSPLPNPTPTTPDPPPTAPVPLRHDSPDLPPDAPTPAIKALPNPYHHAPHVPASLNQAAYADPKLREQQQVIRAAMRMQKDKGLEAASAVEREVRRKRSLPSRTGERVRKGLFG